MPFHDSAEAPGAFRRSPIHPPQRPTVENESTGFSESRRAILQGRVIPPDTLTSLNNLAFPYVSQGRYSEAEPLGARSPGCSSWCADASQRYVVDRDADLPPDQAPSSRPAHSALGHGTPIEQTCAR